MARKDSLTDEIPELIRRISPRFGESYTVRITARPLDTRAGHRNGWPRITTGSGIQAVVQTVKATRFESGTHAAPTIVWSFRPLKVVIRLVDVRDPSGLTIEHYPLAPGTVQHILDATDLKWSSGGAPKGATAAYDDAAAYLKAVAGFLDKARAAKWDLRNTRAFPNSFIASSLNISVRQLGRENARARIGLRDIRRHTIPGSCGPKSHV